MSSQILVGQIVKIANCPDPQENHPDLRRFVVVRVLSDSQDCIGVGISTKFDPNNVFHVQQSPNSRNQLTALSAAICDTWIKRIAFSEITELRAGFCHPPSWYRSILQAIQNHPLLKY